MYHSFQLCPLISNSMSSKLLTNSSAVVFLRNLQRPQPRPSFIACFDPMLGTLSGWGSTVVINHCASEWVSSCCCSSSTRSGQINELSAAWPSFLTAVLLILPVTPSAKNSRDTDCVVNPLQPIFTGKFYVFNSTLCQEFITLALFLSLASLYLYYHGTVDSITMTFFIRVYQSKAWARLVGTMSGNFSFFKSTAKLCSTPLFSTTPGCVSRYIFSVLG